MSNYSNQLRDELSNLRSIYDSNQKKTRDDFNRMTCVELRELLGHFRLNCAHKRKAQLINMIINVYSSNKRVYVEARNRLISKIEELSTKVDEANANAKQEAEYDNIINNILSNDALKFRLLMRINDERRATFSCETCFGLGHKLQETGNHNCYCETCENDPNYDPDYGPWHECESDY